MCNERFPEGSEGRKKLELVLKENRERIKFKKKEIEKESLGKIVENLLDGNIKTLNSAKKILGEEINLETLNNNIVDYVNESGNDELKRKYIQYEATRNPDYSHINFKALFIEMIKSEESQTAMAGKYGIPPRTVSRELAKLEKDEYYKPVYDVAKELSKRKISKGNSRR